MEASTSVFVSTAWQNPFNRYDVDDNGEVVPLDALLILNQIASSRRQGGIVFPIEFQSPYFDINGDARVEPLDALMVLTEIARRNRSGNSEGESGASQPKVTRSTAIAPPIVFDNEKGTDWGNNGPSSPLSDEGSGGGDAKVAFSDWDDDQWSVFAPAVADDRHKQPDDEDDGRELADAVWGQRLLFW